MVPETPPRPSPEAAPGPPVARPAGCPDDIVIAVDPRQRIRYLNPAAARLADDPGSLLLGQELWSAFRKFLGPTGADHCRQALNAGRAVEFALPLAGTDCLVEVRACPSADGMTVCARDLTANRLVLGAPESARPCAQIIDALRRSEQDFIRVFDQSPIGAAIADLNFRYQRVNAAFCRMLGYAEAELIDLRLPEFTHPDDLERELPLMRELVAGQRDQYDLEKRYIRKDGQVVWGRVSVRLVRDEQGQPVHLLPMIEDISSRKQAEEALRQSEERFRQLFDQAPLGMAIFGLDYRVQWMNPAFCRLLGQSEAELHGQSFREFTDPDDLPAAEARAHRLLAGEIDHYMADKRYRRPDGSVFWGRLSVSLMRDGQGQPRYILDVVEDITARKQAEDALRASEARFRAVADSNVIGIAFANMRTGQITDANDAFLHLLGYTREDLAAGRLDIARVTAPEYLPRLQEEAAEAARSPTGIARPFEKQCLRRDGTRVAVLMGGAFLDGEHEELVGFVVDISERKRAEEALRESEQQLKELTASLEERVAERTAVAEQRAAQLRRLAHELTQAEQRERTRLAEVLHDHLQQILVAAKLRVGLLAFDAEPRGRAAKGRQVEDLLNQAIDASRSLTVQLNPPVLRDRGLAAGLAWLARWMHDQHELEVDLEVTPAHAPPEPASEEVRLLLFQAVRELLLNVVKHAGVKRVTVCLKRSATGRAVVVGVVDRGVGFDPMAAVADASARQSVGLFSLQQRLALLGGKSRIHSAPGKGTAVVLRAPSGPRPTAPRPPAGPGAPPAAPAPPEPSAPGAPPALAAGIRILLADDHRLVREGFAGLLNAQPDMVVVGQATDGAEAVRLARELHPEVVIMDVSMPQVNGIEAARRIHRDLPDVHVIGLSMHEQRDLAAAMRDAGADAYLTKGGPTEALVAAIHAVARKV